MLIKQLTLVLLHLQKYVCGNLNVPTSLTHIMISQYSRDSRAVKTSAI